MSMPSGVEVSDECITAFRELMYKRGANKPAFVIYKISDDMTSILVEESSTEKNYEEFLQRLTSSADSEGKPAPRYAVYDVEYDLLDDGKRSSTVFISWVPEETSTKVCLAQPQETESDQWLVRMLYAATKEQLRRALDVKVSIHADAPSDLEWKTILREANGGRVK